VSTIITQVIEFNFTIQTTGQALASILFHLAITVRRKEIATIIRWIARVFDTG
jgi:hypothetical protein